MKFIVPNTLKIYNQIITISFDDIIDENNPIVDGRSEYYQNIIHISNLVSKQRLMLVFLHEITHMILDHCGEHTLSGKEPFIYSFSSHLCQVIKTSKYNNPNDFIPKSFMLSGIDTHIKIQDNVIINDLPYISNRPIRSETIFIAKYFLDMKIPEDCLELNYIVHLVHSILRTMGEERLIKKIKLWTQFSNLLHQVLSQCCMES